MKITLNRWVVAGLFLCLGAVASAAPSSSGAQGRAAQGTQARSLERGWVAEKGNNICGLRDLHQLSNPAKLNYKRCLAATPEMKKLKADGIRPASPEGIQLKNAAATRVNSAASTVRKAGGFCSVWKSIKHTDGRDVTDITARVLGQY